MLASRSLRADYTPMLVDLIIWFRETLAQCAIEARDVGLEFRQAHIGSDVGARKRKAIIRSTEAPSPLLLVLFMNGIIESSN